MSVTAEHAKKETFGRAYQVYMTMLDHMTEQGHVYIDRRTIAAKLKIKPTAVSRAVKALVSDGWIEKRFSPVLHRDCYQVCRKFSFVGKVKSKKDRVKAPLRKVLSNGKSIEIVDGSLPGTGADDSRETG